MSVQQIPAQLTDEGYFIATASAGVPYLVNLSLGDGIYTVQAYVDDGSFTTSTASVEFYLFNDGAELLDFSLNSGLSAFSIAEGSAVSSLYAISPSNDILINIRPVGVSVPVSTSGVEIYTNSTTYPSNGTGYVVVVGAGGGGGGAAGTGYGGGGGGSGGIDYVADPISLTDTDVIVVGSGGTGGAVGSAGNSGGNSSFTGASASLAANGGGGGAAVSGVAGTAGTPDGTAGGTGAIGSNGSSSTDTPVLTGIVPPTGAGGVTGGGGGGGSSTGNGRGGGGGGGDALGIGLGGGGGPGNSEANPPTPGGDGAGYGSGGGGGGSNNETSQYSAGGNAGNGAVYVIRV